MQKIAIVGGRTFDMKEYMHGVLIHLIATGAIENNLTLVCGEAKGADSVGRVLFEEVTLPIESYPADWDKYGKSAGYIRNAEMAEMCDVAVAFWDGESRGTKHMIDAVRKLGKVCHVFYY